MSRCRSCRVSIPKGLDGFCPKCWDEPFSITSVCRADLAKFLSPAAIAKVDMAWLARKMADAYCENSFWIDLEAIAPEAAGEA